MLEKDFYPEKKIRYGSQDICQEDIDGVVEVLNSDYLTQGPKVIEFENAYANYAGSKYAVAVSNGTAALHLSAIALGVNSSSKVITSSITFVASANCIKFCGGEVFFADIDPKTYLLDINSVRSLLESHPKGYFQGIIPVDFGGRSVNMQDFRALADEFGLWIIEDAAHAPGAFFADNCQNIQTVGNGVFAELSIFSFHPVKHIACGEGGMVTTNDEKLYKKLLAYRSHGITSNDEDFKNSRELAYGCQDGEKEDNYPLWYMEMQTLGFNYRLTDIQASLGITQLKRAKKGIERRREIALNYYSAFKDENFILGQSGMIEGHSYHLYVLEVRDRHGLYSYLRKNLILAQIHYFPCHLMPFYQQDSIETECKFAEKYYKNCISIPMFPTLKLEEQDYVIKMIKSYYK
jgi:UDP-4-amino-4,6-dideoxy-N-acetyl-beta-L-altrosamine transaminase